jgi:hypothetical protein
VIYHRLEQRWINHSSWSRERTRPLGDIPAPEIDDVVGHMKYLSASPLIVGFREILESLVAGKF